MPNPYPPVVEPLSEEEYEEIRDALGKAWATRGKDLPPLQEGKPEVDTGSPPVHERISDV